MQKLMSKKKLIKWICPRITGQYYIKKFLIQTYRELDSYKVDLEVFPSRSIFIPKKLPSEPSQGITYRFGPTGFLGNPQSKYCIIPTELRNPDNYCHWTLRELPLLILAFSSSAKNIILPKALLHVKLPFQLRWYEILHQAYPSKEIKSLSLTDFALIPNAQIPLNHDTSSSIKPIGKCPYKLYHASRATPYAIESFNEIKLLFNRSKDRGIDRFYIERTTRRLVNEDEVQTYLKSIGYSIVRLEELTLDEQVQLFKDANEIVGFHGAGLTNLVFCDNNINVRVTEIVDADCVHPCYLDGLVVPGKKATRTYFHMICHMKGISYQALESTNYYLDLSILKSALSSA